MHLLMQHFCYSVTGACNLSSTISIDEESFQALECWPHSQTFRNNAILRGLGDSPPITDGTQEQRKWWAGGCGDSWDRSDLHKPSFLPQLCLSDFFHFPSSKQVNISTYILSVSPWTKYKCTQKLSSNWTSLLSLFSIFCFLFPFFSFNFDIWLS